MAQGVVVLKVNHKQESAAILDTGSIAQMVAVVGCHLLPIGRQNGLHRRQNIAEIGQESVQQSQVTIHLTLESELTDRCLKIIANLGHTHGLIVKRTHPTYLLGRAATMIHVIANAVATATQGAHHQALGCLSRYYRTGAINHLDTSTHLGTERGVIGRVITCRRIIGLLG